MNIDVFNRTITSVEEAISKIKENKLQPYCWHAVKNKKGCPFELGGTNYKDTLELKAYIPIYDSNLNIEVLSNNFINSNYSIEEYQVCFSNKTIQYQFKSTEELIKYLNKTDFRINPPKIVEKFRRVIRNYYIIEL